MSVKPLSDTRSPRRHPAVWWSRMKWHWPMLCWLAAAGAATFFYFQGAGSGGVLGYVEVVEHQFGPQESGRIRSITVRVGDAVPVGTLLFVMDDSLLSAELAVERSYLADAQSQVPEAAQFKTQVDRQFAGALNTAEKDLRDLILWQSRDQAEFQVGSNELARLEKLYADRLISASALSELRTRVAILLQQISEYPTQIEHQKSVVADWHRQYDQVRREMGDAAGERMKNETRWTSYAAEAQQNKVRLLELRQAAMEQKTPVAGFVSGVSRLPGEVVSSGEVVVKVIETTSDRVVGFLPEATEAPLQIGDRVGVSRIYDARVAGKATLIAIQPAMRALPGRISPLATRTVRGRELFFQLDPGHDLRPGETVELHTDEPLREAVRRWFSRFQSGGGR